MAQSYSDGLAGHELLVEPAAFSRTIGQSSARTGSQTRAGEVSYYLAIEPGENTTGGTYQLDLQVRGGLPVEHLYLPFVVR